MGSRLSVRCFIAVLGGCSALVLALPAFAATVAPFSSDPLAGSWRANLAASRFAAGLPRPRSLMMTCVPEPQRHIACIAVRAAANGRLDTANFSARYDGRPYPVSGVRQMDFVTLRRKADDVIAVFSKGKRPAFAYRMTRSADGRHLTVRSIHPFTGETLYSIVQYDLVP
jgi:hypothetical protein